ncbi:MAG: methyltransferase domain-containing protein [Verrucomicrobia bacterium]|nr:methyltransferase domain-containing protein [Verrucomicrobiota bacterium]MCH8511557.1 methyltransferase domain-containing protein [Kiritimatiellia bacterium]
MNESDAPNPSSSAQNAYQSTPIDYLTRIARLFENYKTHALDFLELKAGLHLLDAGCGAGDDLLALAARHGDHIQLTGVDLDESSLAEARSRARNAKAKIEFIQSPLNPLPFSDGHFDVVRSDRVFQHLHDPMGALNELIRVTRPSGLVALVDVDWGTLVLDHPRAEFSDRLAAFIRDKHINGRSGRMLYGMMREAGLENLTAYAEAIAVTDWEVAAFIWGIPASVAAMVKADLAEAQEAEQWLDEAAAHAKAGRFFGSMTGMVVKGNFKG